MAMLSRQWSEWKEVEEGGDDQVYSIQQVLSYVRGAYKDEVYEKAERLLMLREERIRDEVSEMRKKVEVEERLRKELEKGLEVEEGLKKEVEELVVKCGEVEERLRELEKENVRLIELEKECEELRKGNVRLRDEEQRAVGMCERLSIKITEIEEDAKEKMKEMEIKVEAEVGLRKKAEEELEVLRNKCLELELKVLSMQKDIYLVKSFEVEAQGSGMEAENDHSDEAEVEAEVQAPVMVVSDHFEKEDPVPSVKTIEDAAKEAAIPVGPVSTADVKQSVPLDTVLKDSNVEGEKPTTDDRNPRHGVGSYIEINSSSEDEPSELQLRSKYKSDLAPVELDFESDHDSPEVSSGLKRKTMTSNNEGKTESNTQPSTDERILPHLLSHESIKKMRPSSTSLTPPPGFGIPKSVTADQPEGEISSSQKITIDHEQYTKALFEKLKSKYWDAVSSDSSSDL